ncbi:MAG: hypothetical protein OEU76_06705 [Cyclobacteriaceae bacterium]|nr:hypothetical protein [Cyclobacteriaceae bacterium]
MNKVDRLSNVDLLRELLNDPDRKPIVKILAEVFFLALYQRASPRFYFSRYLFKKERTNVKDYFPNGFLYKKIKPFINEKEIKELVENKLFFNFYFDQFGIQLPNILMYNHMRMFVSDGTGIQINSPSDFRLQLEKIFDQDPSQDSIIVKRTCGSYGGREVYKIFRDQLKTSSEMVGSLYSTVVKTGFLFQETVRQHEELNRLNSSCLNTIRMDTFIDKDGNIDIVSAYIRMSITNSHVDNISSGGWQVGIDLQRGSLKEEGYSSIAAYGVKVLTSHPITSTKFENFHIPFFEEAKELVIRAAGFVPGLRLVGWDVAIGESGPILIEGNSDYDIAGSELSDGGYGANPTFRKVLQELNYL